MSRIDTVVSRKRVSPTPRARKLIFEKTGGLCHICGGQLDSKWSADHVMPFAGGGKNTIDNFLPACHTCNRLKWHRTPEIIRLIMQLGIYARKEIQHETPLGRKIATMFQRKEKTNLARRKPKQETHI
jgi:5-methylcytosine-specific restriction endonuclease McrA